MSRFKLKEEHSTFQKVQKVFDLMEELGISFDPYSFGNCETTLTDKDFPNRLFELKGVDDASWGHAPMDFPPIFEYKIVYEEG